MPLQAANGGKTTALVDSISSKRPSQHVENNVNDQGKTAAATASEAANTTIVAEKNPTFKADNETAVAIPQQDTAAPTEATKKTI